MKTPTRILIVLLLAAAVAGVLAAKRNRNTPEIVDEAPAAKPLPRLVDLGADKCIPCKMMAPILDELKGTYAGKLEVDFIDVWKNESAGQQYGVRVIPTQIFYSPGGEELFRHEGFFSREEILAQWEKLGYVL
ncbi:MAG: thioredoxin family protein [Kiritimatiellia bacterium]